MADVETFIVLHIKHLAYLTVSFSIDDSSFSRFCEANFKGKEKVVGVLRELYFDITSNPGSARFGAGRAKTSTDMLLTFLKCCLSLNFLGVLCTLPAGALHP